MSINLFKFLRKSEGATAVEYGLIAALVSLALLAGLQTVAAIVIANTR